MYSSAQGVNECTPCPAGTWIGAPVAVAAVAPRLPICTATADKATAPAGYMCTTTVIDPDSGNPYTATNDEPSDFSIVKPPGLSPSVQYPMRPNTCFQCPSNFFNPTPQTAAGLHYNIACRCVDA